jgi:hypothetical protein
MGTGILLEGLRGPGSKTDHSHHLVSSSRMWLYLHSIIRSQLITIQNCFHVSQALHNVTAHWHYGFEAFTAVVTHGSTFWEVMPCSALTVNWRFGVIFRLHLQDRSISEARSQWESSREVKSCLHPTKWIPLHIWNPPLALAGVGPGKSGSCFESIAELRCKGTR